MGRAAPALWVLTLLGASVTSCGEADTYCDRLRGAGAEFTALETGAVETFGDEATIEALLAEAPDEVAADWQVIADTVTELRTALAATGLTPQDLQDVADGKDLPDGVSTDDLVAAYDASAALSGEEFTDALAAVSTHAKDECNIEIA